jgi:hypothetical protein
MRPADPAIPVCQYRRLGEVRLRSGWLSSFPPDTIMVYSHRKSNDSDPVGAENRTRASLIPDQRPPAPYP